MINFDNKEISAIHRHENGGTHREITAVYYRENIVWELIKGFLFSSDGYSLVSKDGYILKAKDQ